MKLGWAHADYKELFGYEVVQLLRNCASLTAKRAGEAPLKTDVRWMKTQLRIQMATRKMEETALLLDESLIFYRAVLDAFRSTSKSLERLVSEHLEDQGFKLLDFVSRERTMKGAPLKRGVSR